MVGALLTWTTTWVFRREPFCLPFYSPCILTPFIHHSRLLKYADDFVLSYSFSKSSDQEELDDDLHRLTAWSADYGLIMIKIECVECLFYSKKILHLFLPRHSFAGARLAYEGNVISPKRILGASFIIIPPFLRGFTIDVIEILWIIAFTDWVYS